MNIEPDHVDIMQDKYANKRRNKQKSMERSEGCHISEEKSPTINESSPYYSPFIVCGHDGPSASANTTVISNASSLSAQMPAFYPSHDQFHSGAAMAAYQSTICPPHHNINSNTSSIGHGDHLYTKNAYATSYQADYNNLNHYAHTNEPAHPTIGPIGLQNKIICPFTVENEWNSNRLYIMVKQISHQITAKVLYEIFLPYGAQEIMLLPSLTTHSVSPKTPLYYPENTTYSVATKEICSLNLSGYVNGPIPDSISDRFNIGFIAYNNESMIQITCLKLANFIPKCQLIPLHIVPCTYADINEYFNIWFMYRLRESGNMMHHTQDKDVHLNYSSQTTKHQKHRNLRNGMSTVPFNKTQEAGTNTQDDIIKYLAQHIITTDNPEVTCKELLEELKSNYDSVESIILLAKILTALPNNWNPNSLLKSILVRSLLSEILIGTSSEGLNPEEMKLIYIKFGIFLGQLFVHDYISGDPYSMALQLLQCELKNTYQIYSIERIIECLHPSKSHSYTEFWNIMTHIATSHESTDIKQLCNQILRHHLKQCHTFLIEGIPFSPPDYPSPLNISPSQLPIIATSITTNPLSKSNPDNKDNVSVYLGNTNKETSSQNESTISSITAISQNPNNISERSIESTIAPNTFSKVKQKGDTYAIRTLYVSKISPNASAKELRNMLDQCGTVEQVRLCAVPNKHTLFGFIQMDTVESAQKVISKFDYMDFDHSFIRFQRAKRAVQGDEWHDAKFNSDGSIHKICQFAMSKKPELSNATVLAWANTAPKTSTASGSHTGSNQSQSSNQRYHSSHNSKQTMPGLNQFTNLM